MKKDNTIEASKALLNKINTIPLSEIKQAIEQDADINYQSEKDGYTALMLAAEANNEQLVEYLLQMGADPLIPNHQKKTASDLALRNTSIYNHLKNNELLFSIYNNDITKVKILLSEGVNINFQGPGGYTALLIAVEQSLLELVELFFINNADISLVRTDGQGVFELVTDDLIYKTLYFGRLFNKEEKQSLLQQDNNNCWEKGRLKTLAARAGESFALSQLKMHPTGSHFKPTPSESQFAEIEQHFCHPLPMSLKEILTHYNGCLPMLNHYGEDEDSSIRHFYALDENRTSTANIWWSIKNFSKFLGPETLPIAENSYGGVYFLKWIDNKAQVWLFQYGNQIFDYENDDDENKMPTNFSFISNSLDELLEALYEAE